MALEQFAKFLGVRDVARTKKSELREQIRQDLIDQLERVSIPYRYTINPVWLKIIHGQK